MDAVEKKYLKRPSVKDIVKILWSLPLLEKVTMILKQFRKGF